MAKDKDLKLNDNAKRKVLFFDIETAGINAFLGEVNAE